MLEIKNLQKSFDGIQVIKNINLTINDGEFVSFLGPSGCGKTTCLRMIAGFEHQDSGSILFNGRQLDGVPPYKRKLNTLFQNYALFPHLNVFENVAYGLRASGVKKSELKQRVTEALEMVRLTGFEERYPAQMSGGQRQRVAIARAIINRPPLLLLDEPLTALDAKLRIEMRQELRSLQKKLGITFIYVTHDQEEALVMSDRIVVMNGGVIEQFGTPSEIYYHPASKFVSSFIGETNIFDAVITGKNGSEYSLTTEAGICVSAGDESFKEDEIINISVRPDKIKWSVLGDSQDGFTMAGTVTDVIFCGNQTKIFVELYNGGDLKMTRLTTEKLPQPGDEVSIFWDKENCVMLHSPADEIRSVIENVDVGKWVEEQNQILAQILNAN
ncbi:MAG: ABC transporter ATP-binding protein [Spirochaetales bacterium]|nr:ABC transporter ATP-binding protein [Spirochaetales bacterium]